MKKIVFRIINSIVLIGAAISAIYVIVGGVKCGEIYKVSWWQFAVFLFALFFVYIIKGIRLYLLLIGQNIHFTDYWKLYASTTFVNIVIPFKLGEVYRIFIYGQKCENYVTSVFCVILDRIVDTVAMLILIILLSGTNLGLFYICLVLLVVIVSCIYLVFPAFYLFWNRFFIFESKSSKSVQVLHVLEKCNDGYQYIHSLIKGKMVTLLSMSFAAWIVELFGIYYLSASKETGFETNIFKDYLESAFSGVGNSYLLVYTIGTMIFFLIMILMIMIYEKRRKG